MSAVTEGDGRQVARHRHRSLFFLIPTSVACERQTVLFAHCCGVVEVAEGPECGRVEKQV